MMTREEQLISMNGALLIQVADKLGVKVNCNKTRNQLKEAKLKVVQRILEAEAEAEASSTEESTEVIAEQDNLEDQLKDEGFSHNEVEEILASVACGRTIDSAIQQVIERTHSEAHISQSEEVSEEPKQNNKPKRKKTNLKLSELTYKGKTQSIKAWAAEIGMPWPTLYDRVNRNGWTVEDAIETPLGQRRPK